MIIQTESNIYRQSYWGVLALLLINNILGIALNPGPFLVSLVILIGIPGLALAIHYLVAVIQLRPVMYIGVHITAILYNYIINEIFGDRSISREIIGGQIWPQVNILLSALALLLSIIHFTITQKKHEN